jgi:hypothetical protein
MDRSLRLFVVGGLVLSSVVAASSAWLADEAPDGLSTVARDEGFADRQTDHALEDSPVAGYRIEEIDGEGMGTATAGLFGVLLTFSLAAGAAGAVRLRRKRTDTSERTITSGDGP